jgi:hypothetical protein
VLETMTFHDDNDVYLINTLCKLREIKINYKRRVKIYTQFRPPKKA